MPAAGWRGLHPDRGARRARDRRDHAGDRHQASGALVQNGQRLAEVSAAQWCADNELSSLKLTRQFPGIGDTDFGWRAARGELPRQAHGAADAEPELPPRRGLRRRCRRPAAVPVPRSCPGTDDERPDASRHRPEGAAGLRAEAGHRQSLRTGCACRTTAASGRWRPGAERRPTHPPRRDRFHARRSARRAVRDEPARRQRPGRASTA